MATPGAGSNSCGGVSGIIPHIDSQPPLGTTELGMTSNTSGGGTDAISSGGQAGDRGSRSADSGVRGSNDRESGGATSIGGNLSGSTTDTKLFVMVEENAGTGARLDGELQRGSEASVILRGESRDVVPSTSSSYVAALKDNGATSNSDLASGGMINSNNNGSSSASSGIGSTNPCQEGNESQTHAQEDGKRLRTVLIAARLRREVRPATSHSGEETRRSCALNRDRTRLGESGRNLDSRFRSVSPDRGYSNRTSFLHRGCSDPSDVRKEIVDNDVRSEEDNEPEPGPGPPHRQIL
ncbi:kazrin isoform X1 [Vespula squamosa]|uniref:Kazrin isoform X1 n=1 Tax=Vespula squamosa TaxID=30214 RepID=A0ABD2AMA2_VESSQ